MKKFLFLVFIFINFSFYSLIYAQEKPQIEVITPETTQIKPEEKKDLIYFPIPYIPILKDLEYQPEKSALLRTGDILTGMLVFKGTYSPKALVDFYKVQMKNQGWEEVGSFSSKVIFIAYKRPEGTAFISISQGWYNTELRIVIILSKIKY